MKKVKFRRNDRTQPGLPIDPGRCGTMTHDYKRRDDEAVAAIELMEGRLIGPACPDTAIRMDQISEPD